MRTREACLRNVLRWLCSAFDRFGLVEMRFIVQSHYSRGFAG